MQYFMLLHSTLPHLPLNNHTLDSMPQQFLNTEVKGSLLILQRSNKLVYLSYEDTFDLLFYISTYFSQFHLPMTITIILQINVHNNSHVI
jgi:hypothetical protein